MTRYKIVNGKRKKFTKAEETARDKEEEQLLINEQKEIEEQETKQARKESGKQKLVDLGLTEEEVDALIN